MASRSVLITGAAGFLGSNLAERCLALGWQVTGVDCFTSYYSDYLKRLNLGAVSGNDRYTLVEGDLLDLDLVSLLDGVSVVFHLAAQPGVRASWDDFEVYTRLNLVATQRLLEAARGSSVERLVLASSSSVYGDAERLPTDEGVAPRPVSPYGITKLAMEHLSRVYWSSYGVPSVLVRYFTVYGPRQRPDMALHRLIQCALEGQTFQIYGTGEQTRDFTFVGDAVGGTIAAAHAGRPGIAYNLGGGTRRSLNDVLKTLGELLGAEVEREYVDRQVGDARDTAADIGLAHRELGFQPATEFRDGLKAQLDWQRALMAASEGLR